MSLPMVNKKGSACLFFLVWFLLITQMVMVRMVQLDREKQMLRQMEVIAGQEEELIPLIRWTRFQKEQPFPCSGYREELQREALWEPQQVSLISQQDIWILKWNNREGILDDYEYHRRPMRSQ